MNFSHPLAKGLVGVLSYGSAYAGAGDVAYGGVNTRHPPMASGSVKPSAGKSGIGYGFGSTFGGGTDGLVKIGQVPTIGYGPSGKRVRSIFVKAFLNGYGGGSLGRFIDKESRNSDETWRNEIFWCTTGGVLAYGFYDGLTGGSMSATVSSVAVPLGEVTVGVSADLPADNYVGFINGKRALATTTGSTTRGMFASLTGSMVIGNRPTDLARNFDGIIYLALIYDRFLTDADHAALYANPHQIFKPRTFPVHMPIATAQFLRPISDVSNSGWVPSSGSDLFAMIGETVRNDATYISATTPGAICEVLLGTSDGDPASSIDHLPRIVMSAGSGGIIVRLKQGSTVIKAWTYASLTGTDTLYEPTLTSGEIDSITDYTDLRLQLETTA